jgi:diacylglycerol kinase family enzyme
MTTEKPTTLIILNPSSGRGKAGRAKDALVRALRATNLRWELAETQRPGDAVSLAQHARRHGYTTAVAAGGDGTISEVVNGLMHDQVASEWVGDAPDAAEIAGHLAQLQQTRLGVLAVGSGNDFASMVGVPLDLDKAAQVLAAGRTRRIDVGSATVDTPTRRIQRYFDNNMGIGLEGTVIIASNRIRRLQGLPLYLAAATKSIMSHDSPWMRVQWESIHGELTEREGPFLMVCVGNSARAGGGFPLTPGARLDDGELDLLLADDMSRPARFSMMPMTLLGKHITHKHVTMATFRRLNVTIEAGAPMQLDGELLANDATAVQVVVLPNRLDVVV